MRCVHYYHNAQIHNAQGKNEKGSDFGYEMFFKTNDIQIIIGAAARSPRHSGAQVHSVQKRCSIRSDNNNNKKNANILQALINATDRLPASNTARL
jgi:hypothetical protein